MVVADAVAMLNSLPKASVPLIVADPPYGIGYHSNYYKNKNPHSPITQDWNFQITPFLRACLNTMTDAGALYLFCRWDIYPLWISSLPLELKLKTIIAWVKNNWSAGDLTGCFGNQYEQIFFIVKGRHLLRGRRHPNVWEFPRVPAKHLLHPSKKPVEMIERAVASSSDVGDVVLDPFCGSGTVGIACKNIRRHFLLSDVDQKMVHVAKKRLGLKVEEQTQVEETTFSSTTNLVVPSADEWGVHPEELRLIADEIRANRKRN